MSCSGLNSEPGSHQRWASWLNFSSSTGSTLIIYQLPDVSYQPSAYRKANSLAAGSRRLASDLVLPVRRLGRELARVESRQLPVVDDTLAVDPDVGHVLAAGGIDEMRKRVIARPQLGRFQADGGYVCALPRRERSDAVFQSQRACSAYRGHFERCVGRQQGRVASGSLGKQGRQPHFGEHIQAVVARGSVGAERYVDAVPQQARRRRNTARELKVRAGAMRYVAAFFREKRDLLLGQMNGVDRDQVG